MEYQEGIEMGDVEELIGVDVRRKEDAVEYQEGIEMGDVEELIGADVRRKEGKRIQWNIKKESKWEMWKS